MINSIEYNLKAQKDYILDVAKAKPIDGLAELIWNSFDADAMNVAINLTTDFGTQSITVSDDGSGFLHKDAKIRFVKMGDSWKLDYDFTPLGRFMHDSKGRGRLCAFNIARVIQWDVRYQQDGQFRKFIIDGMKDRIDKILISGHSKSPINKSGVIVKLLEINNKFSEFNGDFADKKIAHGILVRFAPYLACYQNTNISVNNTFINFNDILDLENTITVGEITRDGKVYEIKIEILEWDKKIKAKEIFITDTHRFPLANLSHLCKKFIGFSYTIFIRSNYFTKSNFENILLPELGHQDSEILQNSINLINDYFHKRIYGNGKKLINKWIDDNSYPYSGIPKSPIEETERKSFDIMAVQLSRLSTAIRSSSLKDQKFILALIQKTLFSLDGDLKFLLSEIFNLSQEQRRALVSIINQIPLSEIIKFNLFVACRVKALIKLNDLVFNDDINVKELSELHKCVEDNLWIFEESYSFLTSNEYPDKALQKLRIKNLIKNDNNEFLHDKNGTKIRPDLMLAREIAKGEKECNEFLVIELKRPKHHASQKDINQLTSYADILTSDGRFKTNDKKAFWNFWLITNYRDKWLTKRLANKNITNGVFEEGGDNGSEFILKVISWKEILDKNNSKLDSYRKYLEKKMKKSDGYRFVSEMHSSLGDLTSTFDGD